MITSLQNPRVKAAVKLRGARERKKQGRIIVDGARELFRALQAGVEVVEIFICHELCISDDCQRVLKILAEPKALPHKSAAPSIYSDRQGQNIELLAVSPAVFAKLAFGERAEGVVGVAKTPSKSLTGIDLPGTPLVAVLEGVEKPGNVGAVLRSADAAGVSALIVSDGGTDLYNPNTIRASVGTVFTVPLCAATTAETLDWLRRRSLAIYTARVDAELDYAQADFTRPCAIVLGSEADGLTALWRPRLASVAGSAGAITPIKLPMLGVADSLNVSATAAVLFYEALRQRRIASDTGR